MIEPMLCKDMKIDEARERLDDEWLLEWKYDGVRAVVADGELYDRRQQKITERFPEIEDVPDDVVLDGELIVPSDDRKGGNFSAIQSRMHLRDDFKIKLSAKKNPVQMMVFDIVADENAGTLESRKQKLNKMQFPSWITVAPTYEHDVLEQLWDDVLERGEEGLIAKRKTSTYDTGKRSSEWRKVKSWNEMQVSFVEYESHNRGYLFITDDGHRVNVNGSQANVIKEEIDEDGAVEAEIQYLEVTDSGSLRFPSFKRIVE